VIRVPALIDFPALASKLSDPLITPDQPGYHRRRICSRDGGWPRQTRGLFAEVNRDIAESSTSGWLFST
jgi:hypothetical protein